MYDEITEPTLKLCWNTFAIRRAAEVLRAANLQLMAEDIEAQLPPAVDEPLAFGSLIRAGSPRVTAILWQKAPDRRGQHYWESEMGDVEVWSELTDVEVLRVGLREPSREPTGEFEAGYFACQADAHSKLQKLLADAITGERKNAFEKAIQAVEELAP